MARLAITDYLQNHCFWLMDVSLLEAIAAPILNPLYGFSSISAPTLDAEVFTIREGNRSFDKHVLKRASFGPITLSRGAHFADSDFYKWVISGCTGGRSFGSGITFRRDLVLIQFFAHNPTFGLDETSHRTVANQAFKKADATGTFSVGKIGPFEMAARIPARAYMLRGCIPSAWTAGQGFDAMEGSVTISTLTLTVELVEEISLSGSLNTALGR